MSTKQGVTKYCEGCAAKISVGLKLCPYCGIENPYQHKYGTRRQISSITKATTELSTSSSYWKEKKQPNRNSKSRNTSRIHSENSTSIDHLANSFEQNTEFDDLVKNLENPLVEACDAYNSKDYKRAKDILKHVKTRDWEIEILSALTMLRLIANPTNILDLEHYEKQILASSEKGFRNYSSERALVQKIFTKIAIYSAMIFLINKLGSDIVKPTGSIEGQCIIRFAKEQKPYINRLLTYIRVLQGIYKQNKDVNLSRTIFLLTTIAVDIEKFCRTGISMRRYNALMMSHSKKCNSASFKTKLTKVENSIGIEFYTFSADFTSSSQLSYLKTRRIEYIISL